MADKETEMIWWIVGIAGVGGILMSIVDWSSSRADDAIARARQEAAAAAAAERERHPA